MQFDDGCINERKSSLFPTISQQQQQHFYSKVAIPSMPHTDHFPMNYNCKRWEMFGFFSLINLIQLICSSFETMLAEQMIRCLFFFFQINKYQPFELKNKKRMEIIVLTCEVLHSLCFPQFRMFNAKLHFPSIEFIFVGAVFSLHSILTRVCFTSSLD